VCLMGHRFHRGFARSPRLAAYPAKICPGIATRPTTSRAGTAWNGRTTYPSGNAPNRLRRLCTGIKNTKVHLRACARPRW
jgi:hypothetical protein